MPTTDYGRRNHLFIGFEAYCGVVEAEVTIWTNLTLINTQIFYFFYRVLAIAVRRLIMCQFCLRTTLLYIYMKHISTSVGVIDSKARALWKYRN